LQARVSTLERMVEGATGAIPGVGAGHARDANSTTTSSTLMAYAPGSIDTSLPVPAAAPRLTSSCAQLAAISEPPRSTASMVAPANRDSLPSSDQTGPVGPVATKTEFGVDLGSAASMAMSRSLKGCVRSWRCAKGRGPEPLNHVCWRDRLRMPVPRPGCARPCLGCQATVFDGQGLALMMRGNEGAHSWKGRGFGGIMTFCRKNARPDVFAHRRLLLVRA